MNAIERFNGLNGNVVSRAEISEIIDLAKSENQTDIIFRLSSLLTENPEIKKFEIEGIEEYESTHNGLNAPRHSGNYKQALD